MKIKICFAAFSAFALVSCAIPAQKIFLDNLTIKELQWIAVAENIIYSNYSKPTLTIRCVKIHEDKITVKIEFFVCRKNDVGPSFIVEIDKIDHKEISHRMV